MSGDSSGGPATATELEDLGTNLVRNLYWSAELHPARFSRGQGVAGPLADEPAFELGEDGHHSLHRLAGGGVGVRCVERQEPPAVPLSPIEEPGVGDQGAGEPVESRNDQDCARRRRTRGLSGVKARTVASD